MDRRFKERLIGAVVLAVAAVLILPAVLNGPHAPLPEAAEPGETAMRTETVELQAGSRFPEPVTPPPAPALHPPAETPGASAPPPAAPAATSSPAPTAPAQVPPASTPDETPPVASAVKPSAPQAKPGAPAAAPATGWAVQVGTFASAANATALAADLKAHGYAAFVAPLASGGRTLYRVRVGPTPDVESARALEQRLEGEGQKQANVVRLP